MFIRGWGASFCYVRGMRRWLAPLTALGILQNRLDKIFMYSARSILDGSIGITHALFSAGFRPDVLISKQDVHAHRHDCENKTFAVDFGRLEQPVRCSESHFCPNVEADWHVKLVF